MTFKISHFHVKNPDPQKAAKWWVENLGAKMVQADVTGKGVRMDLHGVPWIISPFHGNQTRLQRYGLEHLCVRTDDFTNLVNKLKANGARVLEVSPAGTVVFETPDGVQLHIAEIGKGVSWHPAHY